MIKLNHQYKVDRLNTEISAFSSGDLNKYEFLTRKDLKYKPNELDKASFEFSPLGKIFSIRLDKTDQDYQEEGAVTLFKDIRDSLAGDNRPNDDENDGGNDDGNDDENDGGNDDNRPNDDGNDDGEKSDASNTEYNNLLLEYNQIREISFKMAELLKVKDELEELDNDLEKMK